MNDLLDEINRDLPPGVDWKAGARAYVERARDVGGHAKVTSFGLTKPMCRIGPGEQGERWREQAVEYLFHFVNVLKLLRLPGGARIMDVACGAGWMSHYFARFGYRTFGFDIAADFIALAERRLAEDPHLIHANSTFAVVDIEAEGPGRHHLGAYHAIVLESCLHHFYDPIAALRNLAPCLAESGVVVLLEGENRIGEIKPEYMTEMVRFHTIERPYERAQLIEIMTAAGLPHFEFLGQVNGLFSPRDSIFGDATARLAETERAMNLCVCAVNRAAIDRLLPQLEAESVTDRTAAQIAHLLAREDELVKLVHALQEMLAHVQMSWRQRVLNRIRRVVGR